MSSPTQRTLEKMRREGFLAEITERWNPWAKVRKDLLGFIDVLCLKGDSIIAIQTTSGTNVSARVLKIRQTPAALLWLESPTRRIIVHGWAKRGPRGKVKHWCCRQVEILKDREIELGQDKTPIPLQIVPPSCPPTLYS